MLIEKILETKDVLAYLNKRNLLQQYKKSKKYILLWLKKQVDFKLRNPKKLKIYYFRINKQFRAYGVLDWNILKIYEINNHQ